jgi:hypothetical protein
MVGFGGAAALLCLALAPLWPPSLFADAGPWAWLRSSTPVGPSVLTPLAWLWPAYAAAVGISPVLSPAAGVSRVLAPFAALWLAGLYSLLRFAGQPRSRAVVLASLAAAGAGAGLFVGLPGADPVGAVVRCLMFSPIRRRARPVVPPAGGGLGLSTSARRACALGSRTRWWDARASTASYGGCGGSRVCPPQPVEVALAASPGGPLKGAAGFGAAMAPIRGLVVPPLRLVPDEDLPDWWRLRPDAGRGTVRPWALDIGLSLALVALAGAGLAAGGSPRLRVAVALGLAGESAWAALGSRPGARFEPPPARRSDRLRPGRSVASREACPASGALAHRRRQPERSRSSALRARSAATPREQAEMARRPAGRGRAAWAALLAEPDEQLDKTYREPEAASAAAGTPGCRWVTARRRPGVDQ